MNPNSSFRHRHAVVPPAVRRRTWAIVVAAVVVVMLAIADTVAAVRGGVL